MKWAAATAVVVTMAASASVPLAAQVNRTPNGIHDLRVDAYALTGAVVYTPSGYRSDRVVLIRDGRIVDLVGPTANLAGYFAIDLNGRYIYPGLIDAYTDYGIPALPTRRDPNGAGENLESTPRPLNVNDAIRANFRAVVEFSPQPEPRDQYRNSGFSAVLSLRPDGIARGTSVLVTLGDETANEAVVLADAAAHFSLDKGSSIQDMPSSLMGSFALLRQTHYDANWFGVQDPRPFADDTLEALLRTRPLPQVLEVANWQDALTAAKVGDELDSQYVFKTAGDSYQRAELIQATGATLIVPVQFPDAPTVADAIDAEQVNLAALKHWELAPFNLRLLADSNIPFAITSSGADEEFWPNLRTAVANGLPAETAIEALTEVPARLLGAERQVGSIRAGAIANLLVTSGELFATDTLLLENWIRGKRYRLTADPMDQLGSYTLQVAGDTFQIRLALRDSELSAARVTEDGETPIGIDLDDDMIALDFAAGEAGERLRLNGWPTTEGWRGNGRRSDGGSVSWTMTRAETPEHAAAGNHDERDGQEQAVDLPSPVSYPLMAYGRGAPPAQEDTLIAGATVWTNEDAGVVVTDVLLREGRIAAIGDNLRADRRAANARLVTGDGKHLTAGIIDEHSHIALFDINERMTDSSMVRMEDVVDSTDINIYRNLAGGVTAAQLLHGSANPIGGQSALIKMRWGAPASELLIENADEFIKFALGENVKRSVNPASVRYPQTRMGVEQVFVNALNEALEYGRSWRDFNRLPASERRRAVPPRRDLAREAMLEVLEGRRFVTAHSYVQSEINMLLHVAERFDFNINTFTHILEGYKVADKMARHGAGGSTFSDWWAYKWEVRYAIPYNAALMQQAGVVVAINSDDAEMARRLNQEAAKAVKYGGLSEVDALKLITLNPAKLLHLDDRMGSIRVGKDADLVLWSDHPLSIYAVAEVTWVDGRVYYDREEDLRLREDIAAERARLIAKILAADAPADTNQPDN